MDQVIDVIKALSDGNRLRIVMALMDNKEICVCQVTEMLRLAMPTVSQHMRVLQNAGLVKNRKDSRWVYYRGDCAAQDNFTGRLDIRLSRPLGPAAA